MKNLFSSCFLLLFTSCFLMSCDTSDDSGPDQEIENLVIDPLANLEVIPFQIVQIPITNSPGDVDDYSLFFDSEEIPVSSKTNEAIEFVIPLEAEPGLYNINLVYKENSYAAGSVEVIDYLGRFPADLVYYKTNVEEYPIIFIDSANTIITPHLINGELKEIYLQPIGGTKTLIVLNDIGLPSHVYNEDVNLIFGGYDLENSTVNVGYYLNEDIENAQFSYGIQLNPEALEIFREKVNFHKNPTRDEIYRTLGVSLSIVGCAASVISAFTLPASIPLLAALGAGVTCTSATYEVMKYFDPEVENEFASIMQSNFGIKMSIIGCLGVVKPTGLKLFNAINDCASLALEGAKGVSTLYDYYVAQTQREIQQIRSILETGFGDVKITLTWDTEADIDLWVTDPYNEKIWYENETSSSGGRLDVDNTEGYGPENVYWPENEAPFGTYLVQIHYFGPEDGPVTNCRVIIDNFGVQTTYNQALTPDGLVTIAIFEAGVRTPSIRQHDISKVSSSLLPSKKIK